MVMIPPNLAALLQNVIGFLQFNERSNFNIILLICLISHSNQPLAIFTCYQAHFQAIDGRLLKVSVTKVNSKTEYSKDHNPRGTRVNLKQTAVNNKMDKL